MTGTDILLEEFNENNLPDDLIEKFKQLAHIIVKLPGPTGNQALRRLAEVRKIIVKNRAH